MLTARGIMAVRSWCYFVTMGLKMSRRERRTLLDTFRDCDHLYRPGFATDCKITVSAVEVGDGAFPSLERHLGDPMEVYLIDCNNLCCQRGGFWVGKLLESLVVQRSSGGDHVIRCVGDEGSPMGMRRGKSCGNELRLTVSIVYLAASE
jgi:hypothetical protein